MSAMCKALWKTLVDTDWVVDAIAIVWCAEEGTVNLCLCEERLTEALTCNLCCCEG